MTYLVTADEGQLRGKGPVAILGVKVGVADTRAIKLDETLARGELLGLLDGVVVDNLEGRAGRLNDGGLLGLGDGVVGHRADVGWEARGKLGEALGTEGAGIYMRALEPGRA